MEQVTVKSTTKIKPIEKQSDLITTSSIRLCPVRTSNEGHLILIAHSHAAAELKVLTYYAGCTFARHYKEIECSLAVGTPRFRA